MRYITTARQAEENAAQVLRDMGFRDATATPVGPDGGIDVVANGAIAQVKWQSAQVGRPEVQRLFGARGNHYSTRLFFFAASGYSNGAIEYADEHAICLYTYDPLGVVSAKNPVAQAFSLTARHTPAPTTAGRPNVAKVSSSPPLARTSRLVKPNNPDIDDPQARQELAHSFLLKNIPDAKLYRLVSTEAGIAMVAPAPSQMPKGSLGLSKEPARRPTWIWRHVACGRGIWTTIDEASAMQGQLRAGVQGLLRFVDGMPRWDDLNRLPLPSAFVMEAAHNAFVKRYPAVTDYDVSSQWLVVRFEHNGVLLLRATANDKAS
ncbi:restriction endonuclease [Nocardia sp. NPDC056541]|uniref:restriction endonuclease n=1 Tax=Nocardia sp. NPDC056541 TaxID=3345860 RepID=UPI0036721D3D